MPLHDQVDHEVRLLPCLPTRHRFVGLPQLQPSPDHLHQRIGDSGRRHCVDILRRSELPDVAFDDRDHPVVAKSEEHTSELQSLMRISYAVFCLKKKTQNTNYTIKSTH